MSIKKHRVLIVDDEVEFLNLMKELLESEGYDIFTAKNGEEGVGVLKENSPVSVVIADRNMGAMSGLEFLRFVKNNYQKTIRILISGDIDKDQIVKLVDDGELFWYSSKPIDVMDILENIASGVEQYERDLSDANT